VVERGRGFKMRCAAVILAGCLAGALPLDGYLDHNAWLDSLAIAGALRKA
jgi:hypothetical protein